MSTTANSATTQRETLGTKFRNVLVGAVFALVLLVPKALRIRSNRRAWYAFRVVLGLIGAALVVLPIGLANNFYLAVAGLLLFVTSILLPPFRSTIDIDAKAREFGVLVVVNGGRYQSVNESTSLVHLFVGPDRIWALDPKLRPLLVIPTAEITSARVEESKRGWLLNIVWSGHTAAFSYRGAFAEHLARVAETSLQSVITPSLPVIPQRRAASA